MDYNDPSHAVGPYPDPGGVLDRLSVQFGEDSIRPLLERFGIMLREALASLDSDDGRLIAHRVAGVAGTLGFAEAGQCWLALAERNGVDLDALRLTSASALATIANRYPKATDAKTSV